MSFLCRACGLDLCDTVYNRRFITGKVTSDIRPVLIPVLEEQAQSIGINLDVDVFLGEGYICRSCLRGYQTHRAHLNKLKENATQALSALYQTDTATVQHSESQSTDPGRRKRACNDDLPQPSAKRCLFSAPVPTDEQSQRSSRTSPAVAVSVAKAK